MQMFTEFNQIFAQWYTAPFISIKDVYQVHLHCDHSVFSLNDHDSLRCIVL
jgi:hypothetical protein